MVAALVLPDRESAAEAVEHALPYALLVGSGDTVAALEAPAEVLGWAVGENIAVGTASALGKGVADDEGEALALAVDAAEEEAGVEMRGEAVAPPEAVLPVPGEAAAVAQALGEALSNAEARNEALGMPVADPPCTVPEASREPTPLADSLPCELPEANRDAVAAPLPLPVALAAALALPALPVPKPDALLAAVREAQALGGAVLLTLDEAAPEFEPTGLDEPPPPVVPLVQAEAGGDDVGGPLRAPEALLAAVPPAVGVPSIVGEDAGEPERVPTPLPVPAAPLAVSAPEGEGAPEEVGAGAEALPMPEGRGEVVALALLGVLGEEEAAAL